MVRSLWQLSYLNGIPEGSGAARDMTYLDKKQVMAKIEKVKALNGIAKERGQKLNQMALSWILKDKRVSSVLVGVSSEEQLKENIRSIDNLSFSDDELEKVDNIIQGI